MDGGRRARRVDEPRTAERSRCGLPVHGDAHPPHARGHHGGLRPLHGARRLLLPSDPSAHQRPDPAGARLPAPPGRGAHAPGLPGVGGRPRVRHRQPPAACRAPDSGRHARAGRFHSRRHQPPAPPGPSPLGDVDRRGRGGREDRAGGQDASQHHRRCLGCRAARGPLRPGARPARHADPHPAAARLAHSLRLRDGLPGHGGRPGGPVRRADACCCAPRAASSASAASARA